MINDDDNFVIDAANILYAAHNLGKPEYAKTVPNKTDTELILKQMCRSFMKSGGKYHFVFKTPNWHTVLDFYGLKWSKVNVKYDGAVYWYSNKTQMDSLATAIMLNTEERIKFTSDELQKNGILTMQLFDRCVKFYFSKFYFKAIQSVYPEIGAGDKIKFYIAHQSKYKDSVRSAEEIDFNTGEAFKIPPGAHYMDGRDDLTVLELFNSLPKAYMITLDNYNDFKELLSLHGQFKILGMRGGLVELAKPNIDAKPSVKSSLRPVFIGGSDPFTIPVIDTSNNSYKSIYLNQSN